MLTVVVGVHRLAEEHYLRHTVRDDSLRLTNNVVQVAATLLASRIRNDAVGAAVVAPALHGDPGLHAVEAAGGEVLVVFLHVEAGGNGTLALPGARHELRKRAVAVRSDYELHVPGVVQELRTKSLGHAPGYAYH